MAASLEADFAGACQLTEHKLQVRQLYKALSYDIVIYLPPFQSNRIFFSKNKTPFVCVSVTGH